ncbi:uncharacterized protein LOC135948853, partial [Calliphora vicina]|uniref:uncharacterized protein LOC135948853 n=1 Tax=Calliphora vicina TaxID=7373 RepID=UPI00325AC1CB
RCCSCYLLNANNNISTSHQIPAENVTPLCSPVEQHNTITDSLTYCPHASKIYNQVLLECKYLNKNVKCLSKTDTNDKCNDKNVRALGDEVVGNLSQTPRTAQSSQNAEEAITTKWPPVIINIIDSDNIHVCMCSQISNENNVDSVDSVEGTICPECQNIIKKQPAEPRYRLISKRLMLSNNIIVNRIDTQHLSTYFDISQKRQDPYTPESAESHSPCPEMSSSTSTSSNSRSPAADSRQLLDADSNKVDLQQHALSDLNIEDVKLHIKSTKHMEGVVNCDDDVKKQQRGIVSPVQLKSRLEDLQKKSSIQNLKFKSKRDGDTAGDSDVEDVDDICQSTNAAVQQYPNSCLPKCCNIH